MLDLYKRMVLFYDLRLQAKARGVERVNLPLDLNSLLHGLASRVSTGDCRKMLRKETACILVRTLEVDPAREVAKLLFNYSDTNHSDPAFEDLVTGEVRIVPKKDGEGIAVSAHAVISTMPNPDGTYMTLVEDVPGLTRSSLQPFLSSEMKQVGTEKYRDEEGKERMAWPSVELVGHVGQKLREDLKKGKLQSICLISRKSIPNKLDEFGYTDVTERSITLKPKPGLRYDAVKLINAIKRSPAAKAYDGIRVRFSNSEGRSRQAWVPTIREDAGESEYVMMDTIQVGSILKQCEEDLRGDIVQQMVKLVVTKRNTA